MGSAGETAATASARHPAAMTLLRSFCVFLGEGQRDVPEHSGSAVRSYVLPRQTHATGEGAHGRFLLVKWCPGARSRVTLEILRSEGFDWGFAGNAAGHYAHFFPISSRPAFLRSSGVMTTLNSTFAWVCNDGVRISVEAPPKDPPPPCVPPQP
jgi:hypothetical protein